MIGIDFPVGGLLGIDLFSGRTGFNWTVGSLSVCEGCVGVSGFFTDFRFICSFVVFGGSPADAGVLAAGGGFALVFGKDAAGGADGAGGPPVLLRFFLHGTSLAYTMTTTHDMQTHIDFFIIKYIPHTLYLVCFTINRFTFAKL